MKIISIFMFIVMVCLIILVALLMMSNLVETMKPFDINCSEVNGTIYIQECQCNNLVQLISFDFANMDCGCPEIAGTYCVLTNGTKIKLITTMLS